QWAGEYEQALDAYNQALSLKPDFEVAVVHLGHLYFQIGRYREAMQKYRRYLEMADSDMQRGRGRMFAGEIHLASGRIADAEAIAGTLPAYWMFHVRLALARGEKVTERQIEESLKGSPYTARGSREAMREVHVMRAQAALGRGETSSALDGFRR